MTRSRASAVLAFVLVLTAVGCVRRLAIRSVAGTLAESGDLFASDEDPDLVRDAAPFGLKTMEGLLAEVPKHRGLLLSTCQGFTQYAYAFVETDAMFAEADDYAESVRLEERALGLYLRARDYCLRSLELGDRGIAERLMIEPEEAVAGFDEKEVPLLYWTGASWGLAIALGADRPELVADLPAVIALMQRVLELDEAFEDGAIHEIFIALDSLSVNPERSEASAREHFRRAVELSAGDSPAPYLSLATSVSVANQDRAEFVRLLEQALAVDPDAEPSSRLRARIAQQRARYLLDHVDDLILADEPDTTEGNSR